MTGIYNITSSDYEIHHHLISYTQERYKGTGRELNSTCEIAAVYAYYIAVNIYSEEYFLFLPG